MSDTNRTTISAPLALPSPSTLPVLLGRSNYTVWHAAIHRILTSHPLTATLLSGSWTEPRARCPMSSPTASPPNATAPTKTTVEMHQNAHSQALLAWDHANLALCRFIRGTLAMNVLPFVRRHAEAKALWDALAGLYGEANGIAMAGGPMVNGNGIGAGQGGKWRESEHGGAGMRGL
jgi:hypothetical protein